MCICVVEKKEKKENRKEKRNSVVIIGGRGVRVVDGYHVVFFNRLFVVVGRQSQADCRTYFRRGLPERILQLFLEHEGACGVSEPGKINNNDHVQKVYPLNFAFRG